MFTYSSHVLKHAFSKAGSVPDGPKLDQSHVLAPVQPCRAARSISRQHAWQMISASLLIERVTSSAQPAGLSLRFPGALMREVIGQSRLPLQARRVFGGGLSNVLRVRSKIER